MENNENEIVTTAPVEVTAQPAPRQGVRRLMLEHGASTSIPWLALVLSCVFGVGTMFLFGGGLGKTLSVVLFYALLAPFIIGGNRKPRWQSFLLLAPVIMLAASFTLFAKTGATLLGRFLLVVIGLLQLIYMGNNISDVDPSLPTALRKELFVVPVGYTSANLVPSFRCLNKGGNKKGAPWKVIIGLAISIPIVCVLLMLFSSADPAFDALINDFFDLISFDIGEIIVKLFFGGIVGVLVYSLVMTLRSGYSPNRVKREAKHWCDSTVASTIVFAATAVFVLFIIVEIKYLFVGNKLPEGIGSYAEYARRGVFELSLIALLTFAAVTFFNIFAKRTEKGSVPMVLKVALTLASVCTIVIVISAFYRLCCDVFYFGLTNNRVFAFVFVVCIGLCMVALIAKIWIKRLRLSSVVTALAIVFLTLFACCNPDKLCADYNTSRYLSNGTKIDMEYMSTLSCAAAPAMERLYLGAQDDEVKEVAIGMIAKYYYYGDKQSTSLDDITFGAWNTDAQNAINIWQKYKPARDAYTDLKAKYQDVYVYHGYYSDDDAGLEIND